MRKAPLERPARKRLLELPGSPALVAPTLVLLGVLALVYLLPEPLRLLLAWDRAAIHAGEPWRLLTGQFVHLGAGHLLLNMLGVGLAWLLFAEHMPGWRYLPVVVIVAAGAGVGMYLFAPQVHYYAGFSGALYGMFAWGAVQDIRRKVPLGWLVLIVVVAKAGYEQWAGPIPLGGRAPDNLAVAAHFHGVATGLLLAAGQWCWALLAADRRRG
jgi:rhomboid family GlyGly-CTERM serine protease